MGRTTVTALVARLMTAVGGMSVRASPTPTGVMVFRAFFSVPFFVVTLVGPALAASSVALLGPWSARKGHQDPGRLELDLGSPIRLVNAQVRQPLPCDIIATSHRASNAPVVARRRLSLGSIPMSRTLGPTWILIASATLFACSSDEPAGGNAGSAGTSSGGTAGSAGIGGGSGAGGGSGSGAGGTGGDAGAAGSGGPPPEPAATHFDPSPRIWSTPAGGYDDRGFVVVSGGDYAPGYHYYTTMDLTGDGKPDLVLTAESNSEFGVPGNPHWVVYPGVP